MKNIFYLLLCCLLTLKVSSQVAPVKPNIILIVSDDLNDYIEPLHTISNIETPNINLIAESGTLFTNAFASSALCGPSRTSFLTGKDLYYTQVYSNSKLKCIDFGLNFKPALNNEEYFTIPQYLKDNANYFTYNINKVFHCPVNYVEYDEETENACEKTLAWNRYFYFEDDSTLTPIFNDVDEGVAGYQFGKINDTLEPYLDDYIAVDSAISFIDQIGAGGDVICNKPFFLALGLNTPHKNQYIPEKYFLNDYIDNFSTDPFDIPYNVPANADPSNGIIMPPQPDIPFADIDSLPANGIARVMAGAKDSAFINWVINTLSPYPEIQPGLSEEQKIEILSWSKRANAVMAYLAAVKYIDAQLGRLYENLLSHPEILNNTIIIFIGDNGYSLGEKRHWEKYAMWETDIRIPLIISDFRDPVPQICNRTVSLLDLFPTICDFAEINYPLFADNSDYLDGHSLAPLLIDPDTIWTRPVLTAEKKLDDQEAHCFPQYSVRDERFHYIRYQSNGGGDLYCDEANSYIEEELYEIGVDRETDPNEWNNLIADPDYAPVLDYLDEFLPDSSLYLQKVHTAVITTKTLACFLNDHTTFKLFSTLYSEHGIVITGAALVNYQFKWTNNLTGAIYYGKYYPFNTATIPAAVFSANDKILFYLEVTDLTSGQKAAFNTKTIYINSANTPVSNFNLIPAAPLHSINIIDYTISGSYTDTWWKFGDGTSSEEFLPDTHIYPTVGSYTVRNYIEYGNGCTKNKAQIATVFKEGEPDLRFELFPNPGANKIHVEFSEEVEIENFNIVNITGEIVLTQKIKAKQANIEINTSSLPSGIYILVLNFGEHSISEKFEIIR